MMVGDVERSIIYTLIGPSTTGTVANQRLCFDGSELTWKALQGIAMDFKINNDTVIQVDNLDSNNRLYFDTNKIAENGIFITHADQEDYDLWVQRDNLFIDDLNSINDDRDIVYNYSFGVTPNSNICYLEFPDNAAEIFAGGIKITYIITEADSGNIPENFLSSVYIDIQTSTNVDNVSIIVNSENLNVYNSVAGSNGQTFETIDDAYKNFQRTIGTYTTLVTLRDYVNACINSGLSSNAIASSRQSDLQCTYQIMSYINETDTLINTIDKKPGSDEELLNAFSLKLYILQNAVPSTGDITIDTASFNNTFTLKSQIEAEIIKDYIEKYKSIEHEYSNILTPFDGGKTNFRARPCLFKNRFPIEARIITQNIDKVEKQEIINNIKAALYANLSAAKLDFGEEISTEEVTNIILTADPRISNVSHIENLSFETYAIYWNGVKFREINLTKPLISNAEFIEKAKSDNTIKKSDYNLKYFIESTYPNAQIELNEDADSPWNDIKSPFYIDNWARIKFKCSTDVEGNIK